MRDEVKILFRDEVAKSASMVTIILSNLGNAPITKQDYDKSVVITFDKSARLAVLDKDHDEIDSDYHIVNNEVTLDPFLLNPTEQRRLSVIVIDGSSDVSVKARLIGGDIISREVYDQKFSRKLLRMITENEVFQAITSGVGAASLMAILSLAISRFFY